MPDERPTVAVLTLGCKLNQSDSEAIARRLVGSGVRVVDRPERDADAFVINSCSVTHVADRKARHLVRLARRLSPDAVLRNVDKPALPDRLLARLQERGDPSAGCPTHVREGLRTRAFIKIQEGC